MIRCEAEEVLYLAVYVDDMLLFLSSESIENRIVDILEGAFKITDLGNVSSVLGMRVIRSKNKISIDQSAYISKILERFGMQDCKPVTSPLEFNQKLSLKDSPKNEKEQSAMEEKPYRELIGCLMYLSHMTRPDICFPVCLLSRFNHNPGEKHWTAAKRILRYLKGTKDKKLTFIKDTLDLVGYCDSDHAGNMDDRRSTSGNAFIMQGAAISLATTDAEYVSLVLALKECIWLNSLMSEVDNHHKRASLCSVITKVLFNWHSTAQLHHRPVRSIWKSRTNLFVSSWKWVR